MMRSAVARTALVGVMVIGSASAYAGRANAATIVQPAASPAVVANAPMTVVASGFDPGSQIFVEQCDGVPSTTQGWDPSLHCDNGASPPPVIADTQGQASFPASKPDRAFHPFQGESPSSLFNCIAPGSRPPANSLQSFTNCQLRVSSNNAAVTTDQVFETIVLSGRSVPLAAPTSSTTIAASPASKHASPATRSTAATRAGTKSGPGATSTNATGHADPSSSNVVALPGHAAAAASPPSSATAASGGAGALALSDGAVAAGYLLLVMGLLLAVVAAFVAGRRRSRAVAPSVTGTDTAGERT